LPIRFGRQFIQRFRQLIAGAFQSIEQQRRGLHVPGLREFDQLPRDVRHVLRSDRLEERPPQFPRRRACLRW
jgi:hypothetical protein